MTRAAVRARQGLCGLFLLLVCGMGAGAGAEESAEPLERHMTREEIYEELVVRPDLSGLPERTRLLDQETGEPYALTRDLSRLPIDPVERLRARVPEDIRDYFDLYLYVNKSDRGMLSQQMFVYERKAGAQGAPAAFDLLHRWYISTGRNNPEKPWTVTPVGLVRLDQGRFFAKGFSRQFNVEMPFAMFFDYDYRRRKSGLAIHGTIEENYPDLGRRASAGCIRMFTPHAEWLFTKIRAEHRGPVPDFPFNTAEGRTWRDGRIVRDEAGKPVLEQGLTVALVIDDWVEEGAILMNSERLLTPPGGDAPAPAEEEGPSR